MMCWRLLSCDQYGGVTRAAAAAGPGLRIEPDHPSGGAGERWGKQWPEPPLANALLNLSYTSKPTITH